MGPTGTLKMYVNIENKTLDLCLHTIGSWMGLGVYKFPNHNESQTLTGTQIKLTKDGNVLLREMVRPVTGFVHE